MCWFGWVCFSFVDPKERKKKLWSNPLNIKHSLSSYLLGGYIKPNQSDPSMQLNDMNIDLKTNTNTQDPFLVSFNIETNINIFIEKKKKKEKEFHIDLIVKRYL